VSEQCWCGRTHPEQPADFHEASVALGHLILTALRIPELVDWLNRRLVAMKRRD